MCYKTSAEWRECVAKMSYYKWEAAGRPTDAESKDRFWFEAEHELEEFVKNNGGVVPEC